MATTDDDTGRYSTASAAFADCIETICALAPDEWLDNLTFGKFKVGKEGYYWGATIARGVGNVHRRSVEAGETRQRQKAAAAEVFEEFLARRAQEEAGRG